VVQATPAQGAGQGAQGHQPARSHVSLRIGEHVDPPKDDARHRLNQLADSKFNKEESSAGPVCFPFWPSSRSRAAVTQHTTACCSTQVVDITLAEQASTNMTSLRMVQQKHCGPRYRLIIILLQTKA
jgi:hypothetical protein